MIQVHNDDISQVLILNKKAISSFENQLFQAELEKFRPHQNRLISANHKQSSLMKELTATFNALLQDKRVRSEQSKYENITRQRTTIMTRYKRIYQEFLDLEAGLQSAKQWYSEMKDTVESLDKNVETFVNNRRSEGAQLLNQIEQERAANASGQADRERDRLRGLMERMSMDPSTSPSSSKPPRSQSAAFSNPSPTARYPATNFAGQYQVPASPQPPQSIASHSSYAPQNGSHQQSQYAPPPQKRHPPDIYIGNKHASAQPQGGSYNPSTYGSRDPNQLFSAPAHQTQFGQMSPPPSQTQFGHMSPPPTQTQFNPNQYGRQPASPLPHQQSFNVPAGYVPPPPPPGPPPLGPQQTFPQQSEPYGGQQQQRQGSQQGGGDPWAGLNAWR